MIVKSISLINYRCYKSERFAFSENCNLIHGDNAQGKTNLLEAINLLCTFRPFKQVKIDDLIRFGEDVSKLKGEIETTSGLNEVHIGFNKNKKVVRLNGKILYRVSKAFGRFNVVSFLPSDIQLVKGSNSDRRRYLDSLISKIDPGYLNDLKSYTKLISQRNAILAKNRNISVVQLEVWNEKLTDYGGRILRKRLGLLNEIERYIDTFYKKSSGTRSSISLRYVSTVDTQMELEKEISEKLVKSLDRDKKLKFTTVGPHRDIIELYIDGREAGSFASQGESKNLVIALKTMEVTIISNKLGSVPVLLFDDISTELDKNRRKFLFDFFINFHGQIFITSTSPGEVPFKGSMKLFHIKNGKLI